MGKYVNPETIKYEHFKEIYMSIKMIYQVFSLIFIKYLKDNMTTLTTITSFNVTNLVHSIHIPSTLISMYKKHSENHF